MAKPSKSTNPVARLRVMLGFTAQEYAQRHGIKLDSLKRIESNNPVFTLDPEKAREIALHYGLKKSSLLVKSGEPLMISGSPATPLLLESWQKIKDLTDQDARNLTGEAARQLVRMFRAAGKLGLTVPLAWEFAEWQEQVFSQDYGRHVPFKATFDETYGVPISTKSRPMSVDELDLAVRVENKASGTVEYPASWIDGKIHLPKVGKHRYPVIVTTFRLQQPLMAPLLFGAGEAIPPRFLVRYDIEGERKKRFTVEVRVSGTYMGISRQQKSSKPSNPPLADVIQQHRSHRTAVL